jgi:hypothetical protein
MKILGKYWKVLLALILIGAAAMLYFQNYQEEKAAYEQEVKQIQTMIQTMNARIKENMRYADVQDKLEAATAQINDSRLELYEHFPVNMREEDQIMYILYLETIFGTEIQFSFSQPQTIVSLSDGAQLMGLTLVVNYETTYQGFQDMINYLATDSRVTSVNTATITYDAATDKATGMVMLTLYLMNTDLMEYQPPEVYIPEIGKDNIYN